MNGEKLTTSIYNAVPTSVPSCRGYSERRHKHPDPMICLELVPGSPFSSRSGSDLPSTRQWLTGLTCNQMDEIRDENSSNNARIFDPQKITHLQDPTSGWRLNFHFLGEFSFSRDDDVAF